MDTYPKGNDKILKMIEEGYFDALFAKDLLTGVDLNQPITALGNYSTTYLHEAVNANNFQAVMFLLENGADPNYCNLDLTYFCALWSLQYIEENQDWKTRYEIAKIFFEYGADPNLEIEGETLYDDIVYKVYNDTPGNDDDWENTRHFYKLLVAYGGGNEKCHYRKPQLNNFDLKRIDEYDVRLSMHEDGYHIVGHLLDKEGNEVGEL